MAYREDKIFIEDITNEKKNKIEVPEETKLSIQDFFNDLEQTFVIILHDKSIAQTHLNSFKNKYSTFNLNNYVNFRECIDFHDTNNYEAKLIALIYNKFISFQENNQESLFFNYCLQIIEVIWNLYLVNSFSTKFEENLKLIDKTLHNLINSKNTSINYLSYLKDMFFSLGNGDSSTNFMYFTNSSDVNPLDIKGNINSFLNELIIKILENTDSKEFIVSLNLIMYSKNKSTFLSLKIILLYLQCLIKLNYDVKFIDSITMYIALLLKEEGTLLSNKLNDERFNFQFSDFDYGNPTNTRKLSNDESNLLKVTLFGFIILILEILHFHENTFKNKIFVNFNNYSIHLELNNMLQDILDDKKPNFISSLEATLYYKTYIFLSFVVDIFDFIYTNFLYKSEAFENSNKFGLEIDPFISMNLKKIIIKDFQNFISIIVFKYLPLISPNYLELINIFIKINDFKGKNAEKLSKSEDMSYVIYEPLNPIGFCIMSWVIFKFHFVDNISKNIYFPLITDGAYLLDCYLPLIAALLKRGELFIYMGMEILLHFLSIINQGSVEDVLVFKNYNYDDLLTDVVKVAGGQISSNKKETLTNNIINYFLVLKNEKRNGLFLYAMRNSSEDGQVAFIIYVLRNYMQREIHINEDKREILVNKMIFSPEFIKEILEMNFNLDHCIMDIVENLSQALNFFHFLLIQDKKVFNNCLGIFNRKFLESFRKEKLQPIFKIIEAWTQSIDYEKKKFYDNNEHLRMNTNKFNLQKKEIEKNFEIKKNKSLVAMNLIGNVENLIHNCLKLIN